MIELPAGVVPNAITLALVDRGGFQGDAVMLRVDRLGNRYRASVGLPPIRNRDKGRVVVSRLIRAKTEGIRIKLPLCGVDQGSPGAPLVNGAGQAGSSIDIDGLRPGYGVSEGFWFNIVTGGQYYLYNAAAPTTANADGEMTLTFAPPLRKPPADNDAVQLQRPMIEGVVIGDEQAWNYSLAHHIGIGFEIMEAR